MASAGKRTDTYAGTGHTLSAKGKFDGQFKVTPNPPFLQNRLEIFDRLYAKQQERQAAEKRRPIEIVLPDGAKKAGEAWETSPFDIAKGISKKLAEEVIVAKVSFTEKVADEVTAADGMEDAEGEVDEGVEVAEEKWVTWDLKRPLEGSCKLQLLKFDAPEAKDTFWHSSAHILGHALEDLFGAHLTIGPPLNNGFYYDCFAGNMKVSPDDFGKIEEQMKKVAKAGSPFERLVLTKEEALELFADNPFKVQLITSKVADGSKTSAYKCGTLVDLCRGPHIVKTDMVKSVWINKNSSAYWLGNKDLDSLQRVYGVTFPNDKLLKEHKTFLEEAAKYDHRNVGKQQGLFMFHPTVSPGSCFWTPIGTRVYNKLIEYIRAEYRIRGFEEVVTPNIFSCELWKQSGHYQNYKDDMFIFNIEGEEWGLKPMNCPAHCEIFRSTTRSYRELPFRIGDFGVLHRNEASGALNGLTRVRRFQQDDGHIFCRPDQIKSEVIGAMDFLKYTYSLFGFNMTVFLSTRPKKAIGSKEIWDKSEAALEDALKAIGIPYSINPGDGAFYGPKIDIKLQDALGRKHQCGTIQLDFNLPNRFNLQYRSENAGAAADEKEEEPPKDEPKGEAEKGQVEKDKAGNVVFTFVEGKIRTGFERPVLIHRAVLGSIERMSAILIEHFKGKLPFWLSPRQMILIPISDSHIPYAQYVRDQLHNFGLHVDVETANGTLNKKVRDAQLAGWCYQGIVGDKEAEEWTCNLRSRDSARPLGSFAIDKLLEKLLDESMPSSKKLNKLEPWGTKGPSTAAPAAAGGAPTSGAGQENAALREEVARLKAELAKSAGAAPPAQKNAFMKGKDGQQGGRSGTLQLRKQMSKLFADIAVDDDLEAWLEDHSYIGGYTATQRDAELFDQFQCSGQLPSTPNLQRWYQHMECFSSAQRAAWKPAA